MSDLFFSSSLDVAKYQQQTSGKQVGYNPNGSFRGETVTLTLNSKSMMESAAEEMSMAKSSRRDKDIAARKVNDRNSAHSKALKQAQAYLKLQGKKPEDTCQRLWQLLQSRPPATASQLLVLLQNIGADPSFQFATLLAFLDEFSPARKRRRSPALGGAAPDDDLLDLCQQALTQLKSEQGAAIKAGFNTLETSLDIHRKNRQLGVQGLQALYRDAVLDYGGLQQTFSQIVEEHGGEHLADSLEFLIKALGADLGSAGPSIPTEKLNAVMQDMLKLQTLVNLQDHTEVLLQDYQRICAVIAPPVYRVLQQLLKLQGQKWIMASNIVDVTKNLEVETLVARIFFLQRFMALTRMVPQKFFEDLHVRDKLLMAIQENIDSLIDEEEGEEILE